MTLTAQVDPLPTTTCIQHLSSVSLPILIKRCPVSKSFFTHPSKCYSSSFSITWPFLFAPAQSYLSTAAHSSRIRAPTLGIVVASGTLFGAALSRFSRVRGLQYIRIFRALRRGRRRIVFKHGYGTRFCHLLSIAFRYSYVPC